MQTCDCTHCKHFSNLSLEVTYPELHSSLSTDSGQQQGVSRACAQLEIKASLTQAAEPVQCYAMVCQHSNHTALLGFAYLAHL